jgi:hypothetical protein
MNPNDEFASDRHQHLVGVGAASLQITVVYYNRRERKGQGWGEKDRFRVGGLNWKIGDATYNTMVTSVHSTRLRKKPNLIIYNDVNSSVIKLEKNNLDLRVSYSHT